MKRKSRFQRKKKENDTSTIRQEMQHFIVMLLEEEYPNHLLYYALTDRINRNASYFDINLKEVDYNEEIENLITINYINLEPNETLAHNKYNQSELIPIKNPKLSLSVEGNKFYKSAPVKCKRIK